MVDRTDMEEAIFAATGAAAVYSTMHSHLTGDIKEGWQVLGLKPRDDLRITVLSRMERRALDHAGQALCDAVAEVSKLFYAFEYPQE